MNNKNIYFPFKFNLLFNIFEKYEQDKKLDAIKELNVHILNSNLDNNIKIELLNYIIEKSINLDFNYLKDILYLNLYNNLIDKKTVEFLQFFISKSFEENKLNDIREIIDITFNGNLDNNFKFEIITYILDKNMKLNIPNFIDIILNIVLNSNMHSESKVDVVNFIIEQYMNDNKPIEEITKKLSVKNMGGIKNLTNVLTRAQTLRKRQQQNNTDINIVDNYLQEQQDIININTYQINECIKPLDNTEKNIVSHITDTHGDSLAVLGSLKQTGFIGELTGEMLFYDINDKKFYKLKEIENLEENKDLEKIKDNFVIIPDFKLPDKIPEGIFVHTGDIQDRGQESAESFVILRRVMDLYKKEYMKQEFNEEKVKEELINKIVITTSDHDDYEVSKVNEQMGNLKKNLFEKNFNKHHRIQEDMFIDGHINSGRLIQTNNKNLKILANHSYVDANSVALVLMAIIFPYNENIYRAIRYSIDSDYISNIQNEFKELKKDEKYKEVNKIFNKIKANIIKAVSEQDIDLDNIDENILNTACNNFFKNYVNSDDEIDLNNLFTSLREYIGIPVKDDKKSGDKKELIAITATEILEAFSMGTAAIDNMNRKKMKDCAIDDDNRHYNDPITVLITFRNGRTRRGDGFLDSTTTNGVKAAPIDGLLNDGIVIVNGHDVLQREGGNLDIQGIRCVGNYPNDRAVSYFYKNSQNITYIAPQIFKTNENGTIVNGIYNPIEIKRGKFNSRTYNESNLESKRIENISLIKKEEIANKLGAGTIESEVKVPIKENIIESLKSLNSNMDDIQNQDINKNNSVEKDLDKLLQSQNTNENKVDL